MLSKAPEIQGEEKLKGMMIIFDGVKIHIPTQDTLQDIYPMTPKLGIEILHHFSSERIYDSYEFHKIDGPWDDSYEKLWLRLVMAFKYHKRWDADKKDWIKSKWDYHKKIWIDEVN